MNIVLKIATIIMLAALLDGCGADRDNDGQTRKMQGFDRAAVLEASLLRLQSDDAQERSIGADDLGKPEVADASAYEPLRDLMFNDPEPRVRRAAARALRDDRYVSATADRAHRKGKTSFQVLTELYADRGNNFDNTVVEQFIQCVGIFPVGSFVELNTREVAVVINRHPEQQLKPTVKIVIDANGERIKDDRIIDLANQGEGDGTTRLVTKVIDPAEQNLDVSGILA